MSSASGALNGSVALGISIGPSTGETASVGFGWRAGLGPEPTGAEKESTTEDGRAMVEDPTMTWRGFVVGLGGGDTAGGTGKGSRELLGCTVVGEVLLVVNASVQEQAPTE